ncbi:19429_t:CDS:2, partial [Rhizophagus irregularis]
EVCNVDELDENYDEVCLFYAENGSDDEFNSKLDERFDNMFDNCICNGFLFLGLVESFDKESDKTKTPDKLDKFLAGGDITLNCLISDEEVNDIFEIMISNANNNSVSSLAKAIRTCHLDRFQDIDLTNLALYRVAFIADSVIINSLRNISEFEVE